MSAALTQAAVDLTQEYAQDYWDAGNQIVRLLFGLTFGVYVILALNKDVRTYLPGI